MPHWTLILEDETIEFFQPMNTKLVR